MTVNLISKLPALVRRTASRRSIAASAAVSLPRKRPLAGLAAAWLVFDFRAVVRYRRHE